MPRRQGKHKRKMSSISENQCPFGWKDSKRAVLTLFLHLEKLFPWLESEADS
eukprot:UN08704